MAIKLPFPKNKRRFFSLMCHITVVLVWAGSQYELAVLRHLQEGIDVQARATFSMNDKEVTLEREVLDKCPLEFRPVPKTTRDCFVGIVPQIRDWQVARVAGMPIAMWLQDHPSDVDAQQAGIKLMDQAWASWYKDYQPAYAKLDGMSAEAYDSAWVYRMSHGYRSDFEPTLYRLTEDLDTAIVSPEAKKRQLYRTAAHREAAFY
jgi:hypothetical protein